MKAHIKHFLYVAALLLLVGCSQDDESVVKTSGTAKPLTFTITDAGYSADGNSGTRAAEDNYKTKFTADDACGLYIVRNGKVKEANVKLTATKVDGGNIVWTMGKEVKGEATDKYYLYYPYKDNDYMDGKVTESIDADAETDADAEVNTFFQPLTDEWVVVADQSDYEDGYTASDLMTAKGEAKAEEDGIISLTFKMVHRMALAVIEMPNKVYHFKQDNVTIPDYKIKASEENFEQEELVVKPYKMEDGIYRYIFNPSKIEDDIEGTYKKDDGSTTTKNKKFRISSSKLERISAGKSKKFKIDGGVKEINDYVLQKGDYFCKNAEGKWYIIPKVEDKNDECIAVVFSVGHNQNDKSDYTQTGISSKECHGYAVALENAKPEYFSEDGHKWGPALDSSDGLGCYPTDDSGNKIDNQSNPNIDWSGYAYTQKIINAAGGIESLNATEVSGYPATYHAVNYSKNAPSNSSGWFLPSVGQLVSVSDRNNGIDNLSLGNKQYWSSSEHYNYPKNIALYVFSGQVGENSKSQTQHVRPILAF